jgi:DNA-binding response OmpR family regulator
LVVDANAEARFAISVLCESMGYEVDEADGAAAAMELFEADPYAVVILDAQMPGDPDGIQLARVMRRRNAGQIIILTTTQGARPGHREGEFITLGKPFGVRDLRKILR